VIGPDQFARVQMALANRRRHRYGRRTGEYANLFPGLLYDFRDGARMYLHAEK
jgi:hypothetical protein